MMAEQEYKIFRKKTMEHISTPDQLSAYLRVTNPGIWLILTAVFFLLIGLLAWSCTGSLETTAETRVVVENRTARVITVGMEALESGMMLRVDGKEFHITSTATDEFGREIGTAEVTLSDGSYDGFVVTEQIRPISILLERR